MAHEGDCEASTSECCYICLESSGELARPCSCPRLVHQACLARWQLHSAGRDEERTCRFCHQELQDWRPVIKQSTGAAEVVPFMRVSFNGRTHKVQVKPGAEGAAEFSQQIRKLLQLPDDQEFDVIFHCRAPGTGDKLQLQGLAAFDAAVHCASLSSKPTASQAGASRTKARRGSLISRVVHRVVSNLVGRVVYA